MQSQMEGDGKDKFTFTFDTSVFRSKYNATLVTKNLTDSLNKVPVTPDVVAMIGGGLNNIMSVTLVALISSNMMLGQSSELLWGFMNTIQIMYFFPILQLYFPDVLASILTYLSAAKMQISLPQIEAFKSNIKRRVWNGGED